eukprot:Nk52_evm40s207 gene=Nk52_evmTU40s207
MSNPSNSFRQSSMNSSKRRFNRTGLSTSRSFISKTSQMSKTGKTGGYDNKPKHHAVILDENGNDVTPLPLLNVESAAIKQQKEIFGMESGMNTPSAHDGDSAFMSNTGEIFASTGPFGRSIMGTDSVTASQMSGMSTPTGGESEVQSRAGSLEDLVDSIDKSLLRDDEEVGLIDKELTEQELESEVDIVLSETETMFFLDIKGTSVSNDSEKADEVIKANERYAQLKANKIGNDSYVDRGMQTFNNAVKNKNVYTHPIKMASVEVMATSWDIYDSYNTDTSAKDDSAKSGSADLVAEFIEQKIKTLNDEKTKKASEPAKGAVSNHQSAASSFTGKDSESSDTAADTQNINQEESTQLSDTNFNKADHPIFKNARLPKTLRVLENMVNQNSYHSSQAIYRDMLDLDEEYLEEGKEGDTEDLQKDGTAKSVAVLEPTTLPALEMLWTYNCNLTRGRNVSCMTWNEKNPDILAVGYGQFEYTDQRDGLICCWSFKNPEYPERVYKIPCSCTALDFSASQPNLLAAGLYDGTVAIYNVQSKSDTPLLDSQESTGKHSDPAWQIKWVDRERVAGEQRGEILVSISCDGRITQWSMRKGLEFTDLMKLKRTPNKVKSLVSGAGKTEAFISRQAAGMCFDFSQKDTNVYLVGTEDGNIHKCSCSYNEQYLENYFGHSGPVYKIKWSPFHPNIFLSCSADWTVKCWNQDKEAPALSLQSSTNPVNDLDWSPSSPTVFATVSEGRTEIWDLQVNTLDPLISLQTIDRKMSSVIFARNSEAVVTGDDDGNVTFHRLCRMPNSGVDLPLEEQMQMLEKIIQPTNVEAAGDQ